MDQNEKCFKFLRKLKRGEILYLVLDKIFALKNQVCVTL